MDDRNVVRTELVVRATPEEAWAAIATGPGIAAWFVPAEVDGRLGGRIVTDHGAHGTSAGVVTAWDPPRRFAYEEREWSDEPGAPPWATEMTIEAQAGGTTRIRFASGLFGSDRDWSDEVGPTRVGWARCLDNLRIYLTDHAGLPAGSLVVQHRTDVAPRELARRLRAALGLSAVVAGMEVEAPADAPPLAGAVEEVTDETVVIRTRRPCGGIVEIGGHGWGGLTHAFVRGWLYGDDARAIAARETPAWRTWLAERIPAAGTAA